jgi:hypothetical protein
MVRMVTTSEEKNRKDGDRLPHDPFMAFLDGSLDYSCPGCAENCCRGIGFGGMNGGRMGAIIDSHPELLPWIQYRDEGFTMLGTPQGGCLFLRDDGLCSIESASGRDAKPGLCIMFPFNGLNWLGDCLVVRPYFRCRRFTAIVPPRPGAVAGTHSAILKDLEATSMARKGLPQLPLPEGDDPGDILAREGEWLTACGNALGRTRIVDAVTSFSEDDSNLSRFVSRASGLLGLVVPAEGRPRDGLDDLLMILSPTIRLDYLVLTPEGILRALLLAEALVRNAFARAATQPTVGDVAMFISTAQPLLSVLARADRPFEPLVGWQADGRRPALDTPDQKMAFGAMVVLTGKGYGTLASLEESLSTVTRPLERVLFVRRLAGLLRTAPSTARVDNTGRQRDGLPSSRET